MTTDGTTWEAKEVLIQLYADGTFRGETYCKPGYYSDVRVRELFLGADSHTSAGENEPNEGNLDTERAICVDDLVEH